MDDYISRKEHEEFARRIDGDTKQLTARVDSLEANVKEIGRLTVSVEKMAVSMENMAVEQKKQGERLDKIEEKPAQRWDSLVTAIITGIIGIVIGLISAGVLK